LFLRKEEKDESKERRAVQKPLFIAVSFSKKKGAV